MQTIEKNQKYNVEVLKELLAKRKITRTRFKLPMTTEQANDLLIAAYQAEVQNRHREYIDDEVTKDNIKSVAKCLTADNPKFGIMLCGTCGNGKTTLLLAFQNALNYLSDGRYFEERKGIRIIDAKDIASLMKGDNTRAIRETEMLGIEDMGREATEVMDYGNLYSPMIDLLEYRYNNQLFTFITTNLTGKEVRAKYGDRIADRFNEMLEVVIFKNSTYRK
nr:MAG TPA: replicative helicase [Caudoviricetes sp.]DAX30820.1 MAG TPA: replicative helicase [Caudoviricetes sp.]